MLGDLALKYYGEGYNCSQCIIKAACDKYCIPFDENILNMNLGVYGGFGVGSICCALVGAILALGLIFKNENDLKRKRMELILYFKNEFSCINCCAIKKSCAQNGCCNIIIYKTGEMLEKVIENKNL